MTTTLQLYTWRTEHHDRILDALGGGPDDDPDDGDEGGTGALLPVWPSLPRRCFDLAREHENPWSAPSAGL